MERFKTLQKARGFEGVLNLNQGYRSREMSNIYNHFFPSIKAGLSWLAETCGEQSGITVEVRGGCRTLETGKDINYLLFDFVREMLSYIYERGDTRNILISLARHGKDVEISVQDDGRGFDVSNRDSLMACSTTYHLLDLHDQIRRVGGRMGLESEPGVGTRVTVVVPPYAAENGTAGLVM
ncbi:MAG: hypothetical protein JXO48_04600 [Deltaproteobacteria bacterium]|nr:hypothetical protein [Deltaproteobacteria bacterium]